MSEPALVFTTRTRNVNRTTFDPTTMAAIEFLLAKGRKIRIAAGKAIIGGMALTPEHVQAQAREEGWQG